MSQDRHSTKTSEYLPQFGSNALIALGSNLRSSKGDPTETIKAAIQHMRDAGWVIRAESALFQTPAFPAGSGPDFVNAAVSVDAKLSAAEILHVLHEIEADLGRQRRKRWAQRTIDLDLIAVNNFLLPDASTHKRWRDLALAQQMHEAPEELILPHPRLQERAFVLVPLADIAPDWVHPALGKSVRQMLEALPEDAVRDVKLLQ